MKKIKWLKWLLIILIVCMCASIVFVSNVLAKAEWNELPSSKNKNWILVNENRQFVRKNTGSLGEDIVILISDLYFKDGRKRVSVICYTQVNAVVNIKEWDIFNASFVLAAFYQDKIIIVKAYKIVNGKSTFLEEWKIPFKHHYPVVPNDVKFRKIFQKWIEEQTVQNMAIKEEFLDAIFPELIIKGKDFMITDMYKSQINTIHQ